MSSTRVCNDAGADNWTDKAQEKHNGYAGPNKLNKVTRKWDRPGRLIKNKNIKTTMNYNKLFKTGSNTKVPKSTQITYDRVLLLQPITYRCGGTTV